MKINVSMAAAEEPVVPSASIREYLDAVVVDEAHTIFEQCLDPFVRNAMAAAFPELSTDPYTIQFTVDLAAHQAMLHEIDTAELPAALHHLKQLNAQIKAADKPEQKRLKGTAEYKHTKKATEKCQKERVNVAKLASATPTPRWLRECEPLFGASMQEFLIKRTELDLYMLVTVMQGHLSTVFATVLGLKDRESEAEELLGGLL